MAGLSAVTPWNLFKLIAFAAVVGGVSILFCLLLHKAEHLYEKYIQNQYFRIALAGCILIALTLVLGTQEYLGSGMGIIEHIFHEGKTYWYSFLLKMLLLL